MTTRFCPAAVLTLLLSAPAWAQPANDLCTAVTPITDGVVIGANTSTATPSVGLPSGGTCGGSGSTRDVWFRYTPDRSRRVNITTCGAPGYDTVLAVFSGTCAALVPVGCNDDTCALLSSVTFNAEPGVEYLIRLAGFGGAAGSATVSVTSVPNVPITYQGRLEQSGQPVNGLADIRLSLFRQPTAGIALHTVDVPAVTVTDGLFTASAAFDSIPFDGQALFLQVAARFPAGAGSFTTLLPRQPMTSAPAAGSALRADAAPWTGLTGVPAGFADGVDDTLLLAGNGAAPTAARSDHFHSSLDASDGDPVDALFVNSVGGVGINTTTPAARLHVTNGDSGAAPLSSTDLLVEDDLSAFLSLLAPDASERGILFGSPAHAAHGGVVYANGTGLSLRVAGNSTAAVLTQNGNFAIGAGASNDAALHVSNSAGASRPIKCDRSGTDGELLAWARDDTVVGSVAVVGGTVTYGAFTGVHYATLEGAVTAGDLVTLTGVNSSLGARPDGETVYGVARSARANDPAALGVYVGSLSAASLGHATDVAQVAADGNGDLWVLCTGRDIRPGDLLISAPVPGCAMLDDPASFPLGHVVARAAAAVDWAAIAPGPDGLRRARISVLFDRFTRAGDPRATAAELASLRARVERLEALLTRSPQALNTSATR